MKPYVALFIVALCFIALVAIYAPAGHAAAPFAFTRSSGFGFDSDGTIGLGLEANGHDGVADHFRDVEVLPRKVWVDTGSVCLVPQTPRFDFGWFGGGAHIQPEAALLRMWFVSDTSQEIMWFNEILDASLIPTCLQLIPYEIDLPVASHWQVKSHFETAGGGNPMGTEIELRGHWQ